MALAAGTRLGPYEILARIGAGGMGEVYRARDTKLTRDVAVKGLPEEFSEHRERLDRFEREARLLAQLNHANIATLYGLEEHDGQQFLVMELVEGETLAERIARGRIPINEAVPLFIQISEGLQAAHEKGVIHRDLKPANIKVTPSGHIKILDFGLAKVFTEEGSGSGLSESPTITRGTADGVILGTAPYMSPEQARGKAVDKRTDVWAFGCCLYEALTGKAAFRGETVSDTLAMVLERSPDLEMLPEETPLLARSLLRRSLEKDANRRLHDIADARLELEEAMETPTDFATGMSASPRRSDRARQLSTYLGWLVAALLAGALALFIGADSPNVASEPLAFDIASPEGTRLQQLAVSPDGRKLAMAAESESAAPALWLLDLITREVARIDGTEGATDLFWSPDGRFVAFFAEDQLKRLELATSSIVELCEVASPRGGSWSRDGTIVFGTATLGLLAVPATGGQPTTVFATDKDAGENSLRFPSFLPDGEHVLFFARNAKQPEATGVWVGSLRTSERRQLLRGQSFAVYSPPGYLLYRRGGALEARPFDAENRDFRGDPITVANDLWYDPTIFSLTSFSASENGVLVLRTGGVEQSEILMLDRRGNLRDRIWKPANYLSVSLSPDGSRAMLGVTSAPGEERKLWLYDHGSANAVQFTFEGDSGFTAAWSPDASRVMFAAFRDTGEYSIWEKSVSGGREPTLRSREGFVTDWTDDGETVVFQARSGEFWNLGILSTSDGSTELYKPAGANQLFGQVSPDGRWIAYQSDQTGRSEVYVESFPTPGTFWKVSSQGGHQPQWSPRGNELFYLAPDRMLMSVPVQSGGAALEWRQPQALFQTQAIGLGALRLAATYAVGPDGDTFLINSRRTQSPTPAAVLVNWAPLAEGR